MKTKRIGVVVVSVLVVLVGAWAFVGPLNAEVILTENFDGATPPNLPDGWDKTDVSGTSGDWTTKVGTAHPSGSAAHSPPNLAMFNSYSASSGYSTRLFRTTGLNLSSVQATLIFWMFHDTGYSSQNDRVQPQVSTDGGLTWSNVGAAISRYIAGSNAWSQHTASLSAYSGQTDVRIGFLGISAYGNDCHIDDVEVRSALEVGPSGYPYTSIQAAISAAVAGDTVLVHDGTYKENIKFFGKAITVKSVNGAASTIIDAGGNGSVVTFSSGEGSGSVLDGFTITNGWAKEGAAAGGGITCYNSSFPTITNCIISGNRAIYNGGGISCYSGSPTITNCIISGNTSGDGWGGGISCGYSSHPTITNCTISGNHGSLGAGISCDTSCSPTITNCTISANVGNGIYIYNASSPSVKNTILWGNTASNIYFEGTGAPSSITLSYSNVDQDGYAGSNGNIRQAPLFVDAANGNFRLQPTSPCIDAATSDGAPLTDMKGNPRLDAPWIPNTGGGTYPYYDMGALEYVKPPAPDFDGDGRADIAVYHSASGLWFIKKSSDGTDYYMGYGGSDYKPVPGDYDGDAKTDIALYHPASGLWFIKKSSDGTDYNVGYGGPDYEPVPGDYDGDSKSDIAVYHAASGLWFVRKSSDETSYSVGYGGTGYAPVPGDYDGDWKTDIAVYHSASGLWFIRKSSDETSYSVGYGGPGYVPVHGDYEGDAKTDIAVCHSASGLWFIKKSSDGTSYSVGYGGTGYDPVPGDYDGDGKADIAVYHSASGLWFIKKSLGGADYYVSYGGAGYVPVNLDYLLEWVY